MRKTVHEWLEAHQGGREMGKKRCKNVVPKKAEDGAIDKKKKLAKKVVRKKVKRRPK